MKTYTIAGTTVGCKVNQYDSAAMLALFSDAGFKTVPFDEIADVYLISTCTVTAVADKKSRQLMHRARKLNPDAVICAAGCLSQKDGEKLIEACGVDVVIGNVERTKVVDIVLDALQDKNKKAVIKKIRDESVYESLSLGTPTEKTRAFIKIQEGCNNFCAYCIIPYVRGKARSRPLDEIIKEVESITKSGVLEVVLTGIHVSSYGTDFKDGTTLMTLLTALDKIPTLQRLRLGSLEPVLINEAFCNAASKISRLCPHFHLSLQSGSASVLGRMNRHYTPADYLEAVQFLRRYFDRPAITTDVIVGFPGETDEEFEETYQFIKTVGFSKLHVFPYSIRTGTKAATMPSQIPNAVKKARVNKLIALDNVLQAQYIEQFIGDTVSVLFEEPNASEALNYIGYAERYFSVSAPARPNTVQDVIIKEVSHHTALGHIADDSENG